MPGKGAAKAKPRRSARALQNIEPVLFDAEQFVSSVGAGRTSATYKPRSYVFRQGSKCDAVFFVQKGQVELSVVSKQGKERSVGMLGQGSFIGEGCLAGQPVYLASARALTDCTVVRLEAQTMIQTIHDHPEMSAMFMAYLLSRNSQIESDLVDQLFNSSEKRLARPLIMLAQVGTAATMQTVVAPISQEVIAARAGTTRSRNGVIKVHSSLLNVVLSE